MDLSIDEVRKITGITDDQFNHSLVALRFARLANGVSELHGHVSRKMWNETRKYLSDHSYYQFTELEVLGR